MVTDKERALARIMDREVGIVVRRGVQSSARTASRVKRAANAAFKSGENIGAAVAAQLEIAAVPLMNAMTVSFMLGLRRTRLRVPTGALSLQRTIYSEAVAFLRRRLGMSVQEVEAIASFYESDAVRVMRGVSAKVSSALQETIIKTTEEGAHVRESVLRLGETFAKQGITPENPYTLEAVFRTQTTLAYAAGTYAQEQDPAVQEILWGHKYVTVGDTRVRDSHVGLDGVTLSKDDVWWSENSPPNGVSCRCQKIAIFDERAEVEPPHQVEVDGEMVVQGADPGFAFNAGTVLNPL